MAKKSNASTTFNLDAARIAEIAQSLRTNADDVNAEVSDHKAAKDAAKAAGDVVGNKRVTIMATIADLAAKGDWRPEEIKAATKIAAKSNSGLETEGSIKTFLYEIGYAAHPMVRDNFRTLNEVVELAWTNEDEQFKLDNATPRPIANWAKRKYHALTGAMKAAIDGVVFQQESDLITYARDNDPSHDAGKVFARLEKLIGNLRDFGVDFPVDDIGAAIQTLESVTVKHLEVARGKRLAEISLDVADIVAQTPATPTPTPTSTVNTSAVSVKPSPFVTAASPTQIVPKQATTAPLTAKDVVADALNDEITEDMLDNLTGGDNLALIAA